MFLALEEQDSVMVSVDRVCRNKAQKESFLFTILCARSVVTAYHACKNATRRLVLCEQPAMTLLYIIFILREICIIFFSHMCKYCYTCYNFIKNCELYRNCELCRNFMNVEKKTSIFRNS